MTLVAADPDRLARFRDVLLPQDAQLPARARELRAILDRYLRTNPTFAGDHRAIAGALDELGLAALALGIETGEVAAAVVAADRLPVVTGPPALTGEQIDDLRGALRRLVSGAGGDLRPALTPLDDATWWRLVSGDLVCGDGWAGRYLGGGAVLGPDGQLYPLVVPELPLDGRTVHVTLGSDPSRDPATLGGTDPTWRTVTVATGLTRIADAPSAAARVAVTAGVAAGLSTPTLTYATRDQLAALGLERWGMPAATGLGAPPPQGLPRPVDASERSTTTPRGAPTTTGSTRPSAARRRPSATTVGRTTGAVDLVTGAADAIVTARSLDDANQAAYQLRYEVTGDGRRRAQLLLYQAIAGDGVWVVEPTAGYVDADGILQRTAARYDLGGPSIGHAGPTPDAPTILLHDQPTLRPVPAPG